MRKITILFITAFCTLLLSTQFGFGQTGTIQVGSGTATVSGGTGMPVSNYVYNYNQQIVTSAEYSAGGGVAGDITTIRYRPTIVGTAAVWNTMTVYIANTTKTEFSSTTDWVPVAEMTEVFNGTVTPVANEWFDITFTAPFDYTGGNIVVAVHEYAPGWTLPPTFSAYTSTTNSGIYYRSDSTNPVPATPPTATGRVSSVPQIQFVGTLSSCPPPANLSASNITTISADLGWNESGTSANWDIEWGLSGFTPTGTPTINDTGDNPYNLTGLDPSTFYQFYVRADCGANDTDVSAWVGPFVFNTACAAFGDFTEGFESYAANEDPACWSEILGSSAGYVYVSASNTNTGVRALRSGNSATAAAVHYIVSPELMDMSAGTHWVQFSVYGSPSITFEVGRMSDPTDEATFTSVQNITMAAAHNTYAVNFDTVNTDSYFAFKMTYDTGFTFVSIDDVVWETIPTCLAPSALTATNATLTTADLGWTENGSADTWDIEWGIDGFTPTGTPNIEDTNDNPYTLTGLSEGSDYDFYVRADCGGGDVSTWTGPFSFTTAFSAPDCATTPFPVDASTDVPVGDLTFTWTAPASGPTPTSYNVYAYDDALGTNPNLIVNVLTASADLTINAYETLIYWAVVPVNGTTEATGCAIWSFTTAACTNCPANDDCDIAQSIVQETSIATVGEATPTAGTIENASNSGLPAEVCAGFTGSANDDVWYSFVALTENVNITYELNGFDGVAQLYSGTCGALVVEGCADNTITTAPIVEEIQATGLTVGATYYTRIYQYSTVSTVGKTFNLKIWSPTALGINDIANANAFTYFPNPVKNTLNLNAQSAIQNVSIYNMLGQEVLRTDPNTLESDINMNELQTGAYFVKVTINDATETIRVIKQ